MHVNFCTPLAGWTALMRPSQSRIAAPTGGARYTLERRRGGRGRKGVRYRRYRRYSGYSSCHLRDTGSKHRWLRGGVLAGRKRRSLLSPTANGAGLRLDQVRNGREELLKCKWMEL